MCSISQLELTHLLLVALFALFTAMYSTILIIMIFAMNYESIKFVFQGRNDVFPVIIQLITLSWYIYHSTDLCFIYKT